MSRLGDARAEIAEWFDGLVFAGKDLTCYAYEPTRGEATAPYLGLWHSGDADLDHHGFELRAYVDPAKSLVQAQRDLEEIIELVEDALPGYSGFVMHDVGFAETTGLLLASWPLTVIRKARHR